MQIRSKLPHVGTTIFAVMSQMASENKAINLSQGFPEFPVSQELIDLVYQNMQIGHNQYAPLAGLPLLREVLAQKIINTGGIKINPDTDITITSGASEAIFSTIMAIVGQADEVIVLEPAYDCYIPAIELAGAKPVPIALQQPHFKPDWDLIRDKVNANTKMILINSPHNPSGTVLDADDMQALKQLLEANPQLLVLSDEVYEHIIFDGKEHFSVLKDEFLASRSVAVYSFGKTFHATGWKVGYAVAPEYIMKEIKKVHQYNCYCVHTPSQHAFAQYLQDEQHYKGLSTMYEKKRDFFSEQLAGSSFKVVPSYGTYFQLLDYSAVSNLPDTEFAIELTKNHGVASIPISGFYLDRKDDHLLRFCFAKGEDTLKKAAEILCRI